MTSVPKISVIITTKNRVNFLKETIESFLRQTISPYEILIIDDKSSDGTREIIETQYGSKVTVITNTRGGLSAGRNIGFEHASGDYIKVFDDDDVLSPNSLEAQFTALQSSGRAFVYSPYIKAEYNQKWVPTDVLMHCYPLPPQMNIHQFMIKGGILVLPSCLFTRDLIKKTGYYNETITTYEDWDYLWKLGMYEPYPAHCKDSLMAYRQHGFQMTHGMLKQDLINKDKIAIFQEAFKYITLNKPSFTIIDRMYFLYRIFVTLDFISDKKYVDEMRKQKPLLFTVYGLLYRAENKYQRLKSKSNWTTWHGIEHNSDIITNALKCLN